MTLPGDKPRWLYRASTGILVIVGVVGFFLILHNMLTGRIRISPRPSPAAETHCRDGYVPVYLDPDRSRPYRTICVPGYEPAPPDTIPQE